MVSVEQANEIVAKMRELETGQHLMKDLFNRALRMNQSCGEGKLNLRPQSTLSENSRWRPTRAHSIQQGKEAKSSLRVAEHEARHNECVQDSVKVAALKRMMTAEMAERYIEGPNTYPELRSRVAAYVGEKMIQQSHVPMDTGEVEGEIGGSDNQIDELGGARKPR